MSPQDLSAATGPNPTSARGQPPPCAGNTARVVQPETRALIANAAA